MSIIHNGARVAGQVTYDRPATYLRSTTEDVAMVSTVPEKPDIALRVSYRCGHEVLIERGALRWYLRHDLAGCAADDIVPALVALVARSLFRSVGGKKHQRSTIQEWVFGRDRSVVAMA